MPEQELKEHYKTIFTLKNGMQFEILTKVPYTDVIKYDELQTYMMIDLDDGFMATPLLIQKSIKLVRKEVVAIESTLRPHLITWKDTELDPQWETTDKKFQEPMGQAGNKPLVNHKSTCAIHNNPSRGFASSVSDCDCGAIVPCTDGKE